MIITGLRCIKNDDQAQRYVKAGGNLKDLPPPPPMDTSDYIQCPHCQRRSSYSSQWMMMVLLLTMLTTMMMITMMMMMITTMINLRRFAEAAAERHIPKCKDIKSNKKR